jgi:hypothetical protein
VLESQPSPRVRGSSDRARSIPAREPGPGARWPVFGAEVTERKPHAVLARPVAASALQADGPTPEDPLAGGPRGGTPKSIHNHYKLRFTAFFDCHETTF